MATGTQDRLDWFEYPDRDFPYYDGQPLLLTHGRWLVVIAGVLVGFLVLVLAPSQGLALPFLGAVLFSAIPLVIMRVVAGSGWTALFYRFGWRDALWAIAFALINMLVSVVVGIVLSRTSGTNSNAVFGTIANLDGLRLGLFYLRTGIQLFGEEVFSILPFLALLWYLHAQCGWQRKPAILVAWIGCALWFGAAHLPTYGWNVVQAFGIIGTARIVLLLAYVKTKNLFVSFAAHLLTDWTYFSLPLILSAGAVRGA